MDDRVFMRCLAIRRGINRKSRSRSIGHSTTCALLRPDCNANETQLSMNSERMKSVGLAGNDWLKMLRRRQDQARLSTSISQWKSMETKLLDGQTFSDCS